MNPSNIKGTWKDWDCWAEADRVGIPKLRLDRYQPGKGKQWNISSELQCNTASFGLTWSQNVWIIYEKTANHLVTRCIQPVPSWRLVPYTQVVVRSISYDSCSQCAWGYDCSIFILPKPIIVDMFLLTVIFCEVSEGVYDIGIDLCPRPRIPEAAWW